MDTWSKFHNLPVHKINWEDVVLLLESPVIKGLNIKQITVYFLVSVIIFSYLYSVTDNEYGQGRTHWNINFIKAA